MILDILLMYLENHHVKAPSTGEVLFMSKYVIPEIPLSLFDCSFVSFQSFLVTLANRTKEFNLLYFYHVKPLKL